VSLNSKVLVPLPTKGIIVAKNGKYPYVYHVTKTFRNDKGQPTNTRRSIGKLDKTSGKLIPNNTFYEFYGEHSVSVPPTGEINAIREVGIPFLVNWIFSFLGVDTMLLEALGASKAFAATVIASYMLAEGNVMSYLDDFCERSLCKNNVSDKTASRLFASITHIERMAFFYRWVKLRFQNEYLAYDVTSFSSYAEGIADTEWGYNRDGERLPQINMALYLGQTSRLPVFYVTYPGSIVDKSHFPAMMAYNSELDITNVRFVMDKGFATTKNLEHMREMHYPFIIAVENRFKAFRAAIAEHKDEVRLSQNHIDSLKIFGMSVQGRFYGVTSTLHLYYAPSRAAAQTADMYRKIASEEEELQQFKEVTEAQVKKYRKHYIIAISENGRRFTYERNFAAIDALAGDLGYFCILTNDELSSEEVLSIYRHKDTIEKAFDEIKNHIDMKRLRTHNQETTEGKMFCAFLTLIVRMHIENVLSKWMEEHNFTTERVLRELVKVRAVSFSGGMKLLNPLTKTQQEIFSAFGVSLENVNSYLESYTPFH
jgi:transposase